MCEPQVLIPNPCASLGRSAHDSALKGDNASSSALAIINHMQPLIDMHEAGLGILEADGGLVEAELKPLRYAPVHGKSFTPRPRGLSFTV
jgi:hypothetical protein